MPLLLGAPRGDGSPVLVLPGFLASDLSTGILRAYLKRLGYAPYGWKLGRNMGGIRKRRQAIRERLERIHGTTGRTVNVIGWSLGGVFARVLAFDAPHAVRQVITLGSPFSRSPQASNVGKLYQLLTGEGLSPEEHTRRTLMPHEFDRIIGDLPVPATSIFSKTDGIVSWQACLIENSARAENIEVRGASHGGLGFNPAVLWAIADRLSLPSGTFAPFDRGGPFRIAYGPPLSRM